MKTQASSKEVSSAQITFAALDEYRRRELSFARKQQAVHLNSAPPSIVPRAEITHHSRQVEVRNLGAHHEKMSAAFDVRRNAVDRFDEIFRRERR